MPKRSTATTYTLPAAVTGWNTRDPISNMAETDALDMENFYPALGTVDLRKGYRQFAIGLGTAVAGSDVRHLQDFPSQSKFIAITSVPSKVWDITAGGAGTDLNGAVVLSGTNFYTQLFSDRVFITTNNTGDDAYLWTGTGNIAAAAFTGPGGDDKNLGPMSIFRGRLYFSQITAPIIWYGAVGAVTGALTSFDVTTLLDRGGLISFLGRISRSKDYQEDALFVIVTAQGEVLLYQGDNPAAATWSLIGHYYLPPPVGPNAFFYVGTDLVILTRSGAVSLLSVMSGEFTGFGDSYLTSKISRAWIDAVGSYGNTDFKWKGLYYPQGGYLILNIPNQADAQIQYQFVQNLTTGAWCKFTNQNAAAWGLFQDALYFGVSYMHTATSAKVMKADNGYFDEDQESAGAVSTRTIKLRQAYNYYGQPNIVKQFTEAHPILYQSETLSLTMDMNVDYADTAVTNTVTITGDTAYKLYRPRMGLQGIGKAGSLRIDGTVTTKRISLQSTEVIWNDGDII